MTFRSDFPDLNGATALPAMRPEKTQMKHPLKQAPKAPPRPSRPPAKKGC